MAVAVSQAILKACGMGFNPYEAVITSLIDDVCSVPEIVPALKKQYLEKINIISQEESRKEVSKFLKQIIQALYAEEEELRKVHVAKIVLGGQPEAVEIPSQAKLTVAHLLIDNYRQCYGEENLSGL